MMQEQMAQRIYPDRDNGIGQLVRNPWQSERQQHRQRDQTDLDEMSICPFGDHLPFWSDSPSNGHLF